MDELEQAKRSVLGISLLIISMCFLIFMICGCTLSFQNISTHGTATDLVDETQDNNPDISPNLEFPMSPL